MAVPPPSVGAALDRAADELAQAGVPAARHDAALLLADLLGTDRGGLLVRRDEQLDAAVETRYRSRIERRRRREPLQHIVGTQEFHGLTFRVDRRVLVPRPETEGLVDALLELQLPERAEVADLGTGSGCIAVTLAVRRPGWKLHALDAAQDALAVATDNARLHGVADRVKFVRGDLGAPPADWVGRFDAVVSNPPYVGEAEWAGLQPEVRDYDPREALVAGPGGLEAYSRLAPAAFALLRPGGAVACEIGCGQSPGVTQLLREAGFDAPRELPDLQGIARVLLARRGGAGSD